MALGAREGPETRHGVVSIRELRLPDRRVGPKGRIEAHRPGFGTRLRRYSTT